VPSGELNDEFLSLARRAVAACPALALVLEKRRD
jgi:ferredoxin